MTNRSLRFRIYKYFQLHCVLFLFLITTVATGLTALAFFADVNSFLLEVFFCVRILVNYIDV